MTIRKEVPLNIALWFLAVGENPNTKISDVRVAAHFARHAEESGSFASPEITDPRAVASQLGLAASSVYKALSTLEALGFIVWEKAAPAERFTGSTGRVSLNLQHIQG